MSKSALPYEKRPQSSKMSAASLLWRRKSPSYLAVKRAPLSLYQYAYSIADMYEVVNREIAPLFLPAIIEIREGQVH